MLFDVISPIVPPDDLLPDESSLDAVLTHRPRQKITVLLPTPHFARLVDGDGSRFPDEFHVSEAGSAKVQQAELFSRRNELVQDRDVGDSWYQHCSAIPGLE